MSHQTQGDQPATGEERPHRAGAFDVRFFIGALLGLYGVILLLTALLSTSEADLERAGGVNVNLWTGLGLLVAAAVFGGWARLRPIVVPARPDQADGTGEAGGAQEPEAGESRPGAGR